MTYIERLQILAKAQESPEEMAVFINRCKNDVCFFINTCCDTYNPKLDVDKDVPFLLFKRQEECLRFIESVMARKVSAVYEKTREVGMSWLHMAFDYWCWYFKHGYRSHWGSRVKELVDDIGNMDALFPKFDYMISHTPDFMKIPEYTGRLPLRSLFIINNPVTGASITGEAATEHFGAGPRSTRIVIDELSKVPKAKDAWKTARMTAGSRHGVATPNGREFFWELVHPDEASLRYNGARMPRPEVFRLHWKDDPRKNHFLVVSEEGKRWFAEFGAEHLEDLPEEYVIARGNGYAPGDVIPLGKGYDDGHGNITDLEERQPIAVMPEGGSAVIFPWYEKEKLEFTDVEVAQELDIDYGGSVEGPVYKDQLRHVVKGEFTRNRDWNLYIGVDPGFNDACALVYAQWNPILCRYEIIDYYENSGKSAYFYIPFLTAKTEDWVHAEKEGLTAADRSFLARHQGALWYPNEVFPEPSARQRHAASRFSALQIWQGHGDGTTHHLHVTFGRDEYKEFYMRIPNAQRVLLAGCAVDMERAGRWLAIMENIRRPTPPPNSQATTGTTGYIHKDSHGAAAFESLCCNDPHRRDKAQGGVGGDEKAQRLARLRQEMADRARSGDGRLVSQRGQMGGYGGG